MSRKIGTVIIVLLLIFFVVQGYSYLRYRSVNAVSDAAFIKNDRLATLSFKVGGKVVQMAKKENQPVRKGEILAWIDPKDLETAKAKLLHKKAALEEKIEATKLKKKRLEETLQLQSEISETGIESLEKQIEATRFNIEAARTKLAKLTRDKKRFAKMLEDRLIAESDYENIQSQADALARQIEAMEKNLQALFVQVHKAKLAARIAQVNEKQIAELTKGIEAMVQEAKAVDAAITEMDRKIGYTVLRAPFDGVIAKKFFDAPKVIAKGAPVYALSDPKALYCEVLLSEKKLHGVRPGNRVKVTVDALKGKNFEGEVGSIAPTSASTFSLVPRDIASGEFTKLDQRFVVRIRLKEIDGLRAGMGATVAISRSAGESLVTGH